MKDCVWCHGRIENPVSWHEVFGMESREALCIECRAGLQKLEGSLCKICGRTLDDLESVYVQKGVCYDCVRWEEGEWA
ncbi:MAG TPA: double zinc ribbon domain-containing protein, partial [Bacillales bacterium]|nr:double zinc ribbon domain-containing protein [Bacillales bacterium]